MRLACGKNAVNASRFYLLIHRQFWRMRAALLSATRLINDRVAWRRPFTRTAEVFPPDILQTYYFLQSLPSSKFRKRCMGKAVSRILPSGCGCLLDRQNPAESQSEAKRRFQLSTTVGRRHPARLNTFMSTRIIRTILAMIVVIVIASHGSQYFSTTADSADTAKITLAETSASGSSVHALAQPSSTNQTSVIRPALSEPLLLLLMGALLIAVGASINRLTKLRRRTHAADARQT